MIEKQMPEKLTYHALKSVIDQSPTGVVIFQTEDGWQVSKDDVPLVDETRYKPRVWKDLARAVRQLRAIGVRDLQVKMH